MKVYTVLRVLAAFVVISAVLFLSSRVYAGQETADWDGAQRKVNVTLLQRRSSIAKLAADVKDVKPENSQDAMFKLCVFMRAGMNKESIETLRQLKKLAPNLANRQIERIYYNACKNDYEWDVARATIELFAENISTVELKYRLLKHFQNSGWTVYEVDRWLDDMPKGKDNFWIKQRLRFKVENGLGDELLKEISNAVRENPKDIAGVFAFLDILADAGLKGEKRVDLSWMAEIIKPKSATEARGIASGLVNLYQRTEAMKFYRQAIDIPLTDEETKNLGMTVAIYVPPEKLRAMFAVSVREGLAECLLALDKKNQAQKWMVEADDIREKNDLGRGALFAGRVQAESGQRTIENRIKEEETQSENDAQYWRDRAQYYRGRNEPALEEEAILKGLVLTTHQLEFDPDSLVHINWRSRFLKDYTDFLIKEKRIDEAVKLLRDEIRKAHVTSASAKKAAHLLAFDLYEDISVDDTLLWNWLAGQPKWEFTEDRLLWRLLESANRDHIDKYFTLAEELVDGNDPSRARALGWIMNRMGFPERSIPLLENAVKYARDKRLKERANFTLLESYLDIGDWEQAEKIFLQTDIRLTADEIPEWYSKAAVAAAKAGAKTDAMRIWSQVANINPSYTNGLEKLGDAGLKDELVIFYRQMQKEIPSSEIPARALMILEKK
jgi:tetratricopeptide (TPR) repeat protein